MTNGLATYPHFKNKLSTFYKRMLRSDVVIDKKFKHAARKAVKYALKTGRLRRSPCRICGAREVEGHHFDYRKALQVDWLCRRHHLAVHRAMRLAAHKKILLAPIEPLLSPQTLAIRFSKIVETAYFAGMSFDQAFALARSAL